MKTTFTLFKIAFLLLIAALPTRTLAQTYHNLYLHNGTTGTLQPDGSTTIAANDVVTWYDEYNNGTTTVTTPYAKTGASPNLVVSVADGFGTGLHTFKMVVTSNATGCSSDASEAKTIFILPATTVSFNTPLDDKYCENDASPSKTVVATATPDIALPDGIGYNYVWSVTKNSVSATLGSVGTLTALAGTAVRETSSTFTMTTTSVGEYSFTCKAEYFKLDGNTGTAKLGATPLQFTTATPKKITVNAKPAKPTIQII